MHTAEGLLRRLDRVERENYRLKWFGVFALGVAAVLWLGRESVPQEGIAMAAGNATGRVVEAEMYRLVDSKGDLRAIWAVGETGPGLVLSDSNGRGRAVLQVANDEPSLWLYDGNRRPRAALALDGNTPMLALWDADGKPLAGGTAQSGSAPQRQPEVPQAADPWKNRANWAKLKEGMSEAEVISLLGQPTGRTTYPALGFVQLQYGLYNVELDVQTHRAKNWLGPS